jgi:hypothetical protein
LAGTTRRRRSDLETLASLSLSPPRLEPIFGFHGFGADTRCDRIHPGGPIPDGSRCCCMACNRSGFDHYRSVREHRKRDDGKLREGWDVPQPTRYSPPPPPIPGKRPLRGGLGR